MDRPWILEVLCLRLSGRQERRVSHVTERRLDRRLTRRRQALLHEHYQMRQTRQKARRECDVVG